MSGQGWVWLIIGLHFWDQKFGPQKKLTLEHNTSISELAVMTNKNEEKLLLYVYHNIYADIELPQGLISTRNAKGEFQEWESIN